MTFEECEKQEYPHNHRCQFTNGFFCEDCGTFFPADSRTYQRHEYPFTLWCVIHNIGAECIQNDRPCPELVTSLCERLDRARDLPDEDFNGLVSEALAFIHLYDKTDQSATVTIDLLPSVNLN